MPSNVPAAGLPVSVVGAGSFGTTIAELLAEAGNDVLIYARGQETVDEINRAHTNKRFFADITLSPRIRATTDLKAAAQHSRLVFPIVPSKVFRQVLRELAPHLTAEHLLVHGTKGIDRESFKTMSQVMREETCVRRLGAIAGPNLAREMILHKPAATVIGSKFDEVITEVRAVLASEKFLVYGNHDILGVEFGGTLKNILAIGSGVVDGGDYGANARSLVLTRGLAELTRLGTSLGAAKETFGGLSGIGDIIATCTSPLSRNYQVGFRLGKGESLASIRASMTQVAEGVDTTAIAHEYAKRNGIPMPLTQGLYMLMFEGRPLDEIRRLVMQTRSVHEVDR
jgi:glycerol-3-phosphate dehydrogenase (NAD(P)+)